MSKKSAIVVNGQIITKRTIKETDLLFIETMRIRQAHLKNELAEVERNLLVRENEIVALLEAGCRVAASSKLQAGLEERQGPRRPEWKDIYLTHMEEAHGCSREAEEKGIIDTTATKLKQVLSIFHRVKSLS